MRRCKAVFTIDGAAYPAVHISSLKRSFSVLDSSFASPEEYDALYEVISAPVNRHALVFPYGQSVLRFDAYIANGEDDLAHIYQDGLQKWDHLSVHFVAMKPQRRPL